MLDRHAGVTKTRRERKGETDRERERERGWEMWGRGGKGTGGREKEEVEK